MMRAGTDFTWNGRRYHAGDHFNLKSVPQHQQATLTRLYGLTAVKPKPLKKETKYELQEE